jgi:hypothetical protein
MRRSSTHLQHLFGEQHTLIVTALFVFAESESAVVLFLSVPLFPLHLVAHAMMGHCQ